MGHGAEQLHGLGVGLIVDAQAALFLDDLDFAAELFGRKPSLGLAPIIIQQIFDIIEQLRKDGVTVFLVEQNANQALKIADRAYVLENGRVVMQGTGEALLTFRPVKPESHRPPCS